MENKFKIKKLGIAELIKFNKWDKSLDKRDFKVRYSLLYTAPMGIVKQISKLKSRKTRKSFVLYDKRALCGWCFYDLVNTNNQTILYVNSLFIHPDCQDKGYGKQFLKMILEDLTKKNIKVDYLEVLVDYENKAGINFFEKLGKNEKSPAGNDFWKYRFDAEKILIKLQSLNKKDVEKSK